MTNSCMPCSFCIHDKDFAFENAQKPKKDELDFLKDISKSNCSLCWGEGCLTVKVLENSMTPEMVEDFLGVNLDKDNP